MYAIGGLQPSDLPAARRAGAHGLLVVTLADLNRRYDFENKFRISTEAMLSTLFARFELSPSAAVG